MFRDKNGVYYKYPERSCKRCQLYPCVPNMDKLLSDFAKYGCTNWLDVNTFEIKKESRKK